MGDHSPLLSERDRFWLPHHHAWVASGLTRKAYSIQHGLNHNAFNSGSRRLRQKGALSTPTLSESSTIFSRVIRVPEAESPQVRRIGIDTHLWLELEAPVSLVDAVKLLRTLIYEEAKQSHPERWSGKIRDWSIVGPTTLNPEREERIQQKAA